MCLVTFYQSIWLGWCSMLLKQPINKDISVFFFPLIPSHNTCSKNMHTGIRDCWLVIVIPSSRFWCKWGEIKGYVSANALGTVLFPLLCAARQLSFQLSFMNTDVFPRFSLGMVLQCPFFEITMTILLYSIDTLTCWYVEGISVMIQSSVKNPFLQSAA